MRALKQHIILFLLMLCTVSNAMAQSKNNLLLDRDHLVLLIDLKSTRAQIDSILKTAGITGVKADMVLKGDYDALRKDGWNIVKLHDGLLQFDRSLKTLNSSLITSPFQITTKLSKTQGRPGYPDEVMFGVNSFTRVTVHELPSGLTRFFVPGNTNAKRVLLSGSFNDWSTGKGIMSRTDSGWISDVKLDPGIYAYKFIINGDWTIDTYNKLRQDDGVGNTNSIYYRYNYTFKLPGYIAAHKVTVAGNFNNWNPNQLEMTRGPGGWQKSLYLHDGMHAYRFMVDGQWIADPLNPNNKKNGSATESVLNLGETVTFKLDGFSTAHEVFVAGSFNNWKNGELALKHNGNSWTLPYTFSPGNYQYKFIVDGRWMTDPANPHTVNLDGQTNSFLVVKPNHTFTLKGYSHAHTIRISGNFNNWAEDGYTLAHQGDTWTISLRLKPGKCLYKFIVDGTWVLDNTNKQWEQNEFGTGNSVLWMDQ
ncbi:hypothetical protein [Mucilaginibacter boryungensis]|uniref:CBM20 domain-containing protein n=1 Tax=Mucilaginibacter boryungensis TaxID=768480 RepID=A0ABR9XHX2_9SPHI|nr:hypothetical protein [Mucilaginibacter boryungensis]MBE9666669.1 hypothetical protein [Mucilaginibacter boryungensis]